VVLGDLRGHRLPRGSHVALGVAGDLSGSGVTLGVTDGLVSLHMAYGAAGGLVGSWVAKGGRGWPLAVTVDLRVVGDTNYMLNFYKCSYVLNFHFRNAPNSVSDEKSN
jgi:hypothetical protein